MVACGGACSILMWQKNAKLREENGLLREGNARMEERLKLAENNDARRQEEQQINEERFRLLANDIMTQHADRFRSENEIRMAEILTPLRENIDSFRKSITECYANEARERFSLGEKIKDLIATNQSIGREAKELSAALRGNNKTQGDWGEMILESILEKSGLRKGSEFVVQQTTDEFGKTLRDDDGNHLRPDVIVNYPDGRAVIIDSKVSLTAFVDYANSDDPEARKRYGLLHAESVRKHIDELSAKRYQDYIGREKTDFVMMFIPNEAAYMAAMNTDSSLWNRAYEKRVLIVSPTHLVSALRLIAQLWSHDRQTRNAIEIAEKSGKMYDKFVGFVDDMEKIRKSIVSTQAAYDSAMKKLRDGTGNLIDRAESLREMGAKAAKRLRENPE